MLADVINALVLGSIYSLFALGMSLVWGTTGVLNFAHGGIFLFAAFADYLLLNSVRLPLVPLLLIGMVVGALLAVLIQLLAFGSIMRRNRRKEAAELQILICGIGLAGILTGLVQIKTLGNPFGFSNSSYKISTFSVAGQHIAGIDVIVIVLGIALSAVVGLWVRRSKNGLALRAMGVDTETALLMGIDGTRLGLSAMAISGALACGSRNAAHFYLQHYRFRHRVDPPAEGLRRHYSRRRWQRRGNVARLLFLGHMRDSGTGPNQRSVG